MQQRSGTHRSAPSPRCREAGRICPGIPAVIETDPYSLFIPAAWVCCAYCLRLLTDAIYAVLKDAVGHADVDDIPYLLADQRLPNRRRIRDQIIIGVSLDGANQRELPFVIRLQIGHLADEANADMFGRNVGRVE